MIFVCLMALLFHQAMAQIICIDQNKTFSIKKIQSYYCLIKRPVPQFFFQFMDSTFLHQQSQPRVGNDPGAAIAAIMGTIFQMHFVILTIMWAGVANLGLIVPLFRHTVVTYYLHAIIMWVLAIFTFAGSFLQLIAESGNLPNGDIHETFGIITMACTLVICVLGVWMRVSQESSNIPGWVVHYSRYVHAIGGIIVWLVAQVALLLAWHGINETVFIALLVWQVIFIILRTAYRFFPPRIQSKVIDHQTEEKDFQNEIRVVKKTNDLRIYSTDYCVFSDYVYSLEGLYSKHPGGYQIIANIRTREIDRFIYGMESLEILSSVPRFSHTRWAMNLAGKPIARFERFNPYSGMEEENQCRIQSLRQLSAGSSVYLLELVGSDGRKFGYKGFQNISQLGQYFTLTIKKCNTKTRLYTSVNCMNVSNRRLMASISPEMGQYLGVSIFSVEKNDASESLVSMQERVSSSQTSRDQCLPLLIKKYDDGYFTSDLISPQFNESVSVTRSKGLGLALQEKKPGKIILMAGGTGIYPFIDTIDILYKKALVDQNHSMKQKILETNPAVVDACLNNFSFLVYASFNSHLDMHPMTLFQLSELSQMLPPHKFNCMLKIREYPQEKFSTTYKGIKMSTDRFEQFLNKELEGQKVEEVSQIYMCGPGKMTESILGVLEEKKMTLDTYTVI